METERASLYNGGMGSQVDFAVRRTEKLKEPSDFKVVLLNDDYTSMDFVVDVLVLIFNKNEADAERIMMDVHRKGRAVVGVYTRDIACTKAGQVHSLAKQNDFPLRCVIEPS